MSLTEKVRIESEVPELARAVAVVRADRGIEARLERMVYEAVRIVAGVLFVAWGVGCAALAGLAGSTGLVVASAVVFANALLIRLMARFAPSTLQEGEGDSGDSLEGVPDGPARVLILALSVTVFLPAVAVGFLWHSDASLRQFDEKRRKADAVAADPRWPALRRLFAAIERQNEIAAEGISVDDHAAILAPLLEEARINTYLRPLGRAHQPLSPAFHRGLDRLESVTAVLNLEKDRLRDRVD